MLNIELVKYPLFIRKAIRPSKVSMSTYFPSGTQYFYAYPSGEHSSFLNKVPPITEELVAARTISCAGPNVSAVSFASTNAPLMDNDLLEALAIPQVDPKHITILPKGIDAHLFGKKRNEAIMDALAKTIAPGRLVMAQPYTDEVMAALYQIPAKLTVWLNDKDNMQRYIPPSLIPERFGSYHSGNDFINNAANISTPCVVKISSSSSGDGVFICHDKEALDDACKQLKQFDGTIIVEKYLEAKKNYGVHFGIPHDQTKPIDIIGVNEQITTANGEFLGGFIDDSQLHGEITAVKRHLLDSILPTVRDMGWYGVGGFDVIIDKDDKAYFIDCNFRMTGMSAYHFLVAQKTIKSPLVSFSGQFNGTQRAFTDMILPFAGKNSPEKIVQLIALSKYGNGWNFNGALMYNNQDQLQENIKKLLAANIRSQVLEQLI